MIPGVSAGSNQVGASDTWMPQVSWPCGAAGETDRRRKRAWRPPGQVASWPAPTSLLQRGLGSSVEQPCAGVCAILGEASRTKGLAGWSSERLPSCPLQRDVLIGCGVGKARDLAEPRLADARSDPVDEGELPDRRVDHSL